MDASPFARLSPELRNQIWAFVVKAEGALDLSIWGDFEPPVTRVCKQVRHETQLMFYAENEFETSIMAGGNRCAGRWLNIIGPTRRRHVKCLTFHHFRHWDNTRPLAPGNPLLCKGPKMVKVIEYTNEGSINILEWTRHRNRYMRVVKIVG